jgi:hypothetical protein
MHTIAATCLSIPLIKEKLGDIVGLLIVILIAWGVFHVLKEFAKAGTLVALIAAAIVVAAALWLTQGGGMVAIANGLSHWLGTGSVSDLLQTSSNAAASGC